jgi:hypothetical protein
MKEIQSWIEKNVSPPGLQKKNRGSLFRVIADVFDLVKADALKAFNAHFPYLADAKKLEEHGNALLVPRLLYDSDAEYRERVAAASFFLTRAGERSYIVEQLKAHFDERYQVSDEFLEVYVKVLELSDADRHWLLEFLDGLINPNVKISVAEWFHFVEKVVMREALAMRSRMNLYDTFNDRGIKLNGIVKLDGRTLNNTVKYQPKLNGEWRLYGDIALSGMLVLPALGFVRIPVRLGRGILDSVGLDVKPVHIDNYNARIKLTGTTKLDGLEELDGHGRINDRIDMKSTMSLVDAFVGITDPLKISVNMRPRDKYLFPLALNGTTKLEGYAKLDGVSGATDRVRITGKITHLERYSARIKLNGTMKLDGTENLGGFSGINDKVTMRSKMAIKDTFNGIFDVLKMGVNVSPRDKYLFPLALSGTIKLEGYAKLNGVSGATDKVRITGKTSYAERYSARVKLSGTVKLDRAENLSGFSGIHDRLKIGLRYCRKLSGQYQLGGSIKMNSGVLLAA